MSASALVLLLGLLATPAAAHERTTSYSSWEVRGRQAHVTVRLSELDVSRFPWAAAADRDRALAAYLARHLQLLAGDAACPVVGGPRPLASVPGRVVYEWELACPASDALRIRSDLLLDVAPAHLHFVRVAREGARAPEHVLSEDERTWSLADAPLGTSLGSYFRLGVEHILTGYDHLAFLVALLLIGGSLGQVARVVTGFTVAHSITLGLAVLGCVRPERAPVEALIGLSIALVAAENVWLVGARPRILPALIAGALGSLALAAWAGHGRIPALTLAGLGLSALCYFGLLERMARPEALRWGVAFLFGLVHGFGFAAVLADARLDADRLAHALLGFNLGVEAGQLAVVALAWPLLRQAARRQIALVELGSAATAGLGLFWFVTRAFG